MVKYNIWYKRICTVMELDRSEVVEIMALAGVEISKSRAEGWRRGENDRRRFVRMSEREFDQLTYGLIEWSKK